MALMMAGMGVVGAAHLALAVTDDWADGTGNWNTPSNWSAHVVPGTTDIVFIANSDGTARTVTYDYNGPAVSLGSLTIDLTGAGTGFDKLTMTGNTASIIAGLFIGTNGRGTFAQSGSTSSVSATSLSLGLNAGSNGGYTLTGGTSVIGSAGVGNAYVGGGSGGSGGVGTLTISGGSLNVAGTTKVWNTGSIINLTSGTLSTGVLDIGSNASLLHMTGGTLALTATGTYVPTTVVSGGTLALSAANGDMTVTGPAGGLTNNGTMVFGSPGGTYNTTYAGNITNNATKAIRITGGGWGAVGGGGSRVINGTLDNFGAIAFLSNFPYSPANADGTPLIANAITMENNSQMFPMIGPPGQSNTLIATNSGGLTLGPVVNIDLGKAHNVGPSSYGPGTYTLMHYNGTLNGSVNSLTLQSSSSLYAYQFINDSANGNIDLDIIPATQNAWNGSAGTATWDGANWAGGSAPNSSANQCAVFPSPIPNGQGTITLGNGETANGLKFNDSYTLTGGSLQVGNWGMIDVTGGKSATIASALSASFGLTKTGLGTLTLSGANTYVGGANASTGTLNAGAANTFPAGSSIQATGGTLSTGGFNQTVATMILSSGKINITGGTVSVTNGVMVNAAPGAGNINLSGGVLKTPSVQNSGNSSALNWTAGTLQLTGTGSVPVLTVPAGGSLSLNPTAGNVVVTGYPQGGGPAKPATVSVPSPNYYPDRSGATIDSIVIHTTEQSTVQQTLTQFQDPASQTSAAYVNGSDGTIYEMVDPALGRAAWHATYYNDRSIGIENQGFSDQASTWNSQNIASLEALVAYLAYTYKVPVLRPTDNSQYNVGPNPSFPVDVTFNEPGIMAHGQIQPWDRYDPGQFFPWTSFISDVQTIIANSLTPAALTNNGTINVTNSGGWGVTYRGDINNAGAFNVTTTNLTLNGNVNNSAQMTLNGGLLAVNGNEIHAGSGGIATFTHNSGTHTVSGTLTIGVGGGTGGSGTYNLVGGSVSAASTAIGVNGSFQFNGGSASLGNLSLTGNGQLTMSAGHNKALVLNSLTMASGALLDLSDNSIIVNYSAGDTTHSTRDAIRNLLKNGRNGAAGQPGAWNGLGGISSSFAHNNGNGFNLAIGYGDNEDIALVRGSGSYTAFGGQTVASNTVLVQMTRGADATLDGVVDAQDVTILGSHFNKPGSGQWVFGDFDYSGTCDSTDVTTLGSTFGKTSPVLSPAQMTAEFGSAFTSAFEAGQSGAVPEPGSLALIGLGGLALLGRRSRKRRGG